MGGRRLGGSGIGEVKGSGRRRGESEIRGRGADGGASGRMGRRGWTKRMDKEDGVRRRGFYGIIGVGASYERVGAAAIYIGQEGRKMRKSPEHRLRINRNLISKVSDTDGRF